MCSSDLNWGALDHSIRRKRTLQSILNMAEFFWVHCKVPLPAQLTMPSLIDHINMFRNSGTRFRNQDPATDGYTFTETNKSVPTEGPWADARKLETAKSKRNEDFERVVNKSMVSTGTILYDLPYESYPAMIAHVGRFGVHELLGKQIKELSGMEISHKTKMEALKKCMARRGAYEIDQLIKCKKRDDEYTTPAGNTKPQMTFQDFCKSESCYELETNDNVRISMIRNYVRSLDKISSKELTKRYNAFVEHMKSDTPPLLNPEQVNAYDNIESRIETQNNTGLCIVPPSVKYDPNLFWTWAERLLNHSIKEAPNRIQQLPDALKTTMYNVIARIERDDEIEVIDASDLVSVLSVIQQKKTFMDEHNEKLSWEIGRAHV